MVINKKIKRTMLQNKSQYIGSLALIIISCMLYTMFNQLAVNMDKMTSSFERNYVQDDASFIVDKTINNPKKLEEKFNMKLEKSGSFDYEISKGKTLRIFSENRKIDIPAVISGNKLTTNGILIDPSYAKANNIKVGDKITIGNKKLNVSGLMSLPNYIYAIKSESDIMNNPKSFGIAVITKNNFDSLNLGSSFYNIKFNNSENIDSKISKLKSYLKSQNINVLSWTNIDENPRVTYVTAKIKSTKSISSSMPIAILLLTCSMTGIIMLRMLQKEAVIIGTLYALGYRKREIRKHYLTYSLSIAVIGGIVGTILGGLALKPMVTFMVSYFNVPTNYLSFDIKYVVISILLPIIFLFISSYFIINKQLKHSPVDLMHGGIENSKVNFFERHLKLDNFKFNSKFKIRQQLRSIPRSLLLLFGIIASTMLLLLGFATKNSMDFLMQESITSTYKYKYQYIFNSLQTTSPSRGEKFSETAFSLKSNNKTIITAYGINPNTRYLLLKDRSGNSLDKNKVIVTKTLSDKLNIKENDKIKVINRFNSKVYTIRIDSIADTYSSQSLYMPLSRFNTMLNYPSGSYIGLWSDNKINIPENKLISTSNIDDFKTALSTATKPLQYSMGSISLMSFIIGLIIIYVVTSLIIEENKENISLMKVLGYRKKEVYSLILNSSSFIVILGYLLGIPFLLGSLNALFKSMTSTMNLSLKVKLNFTYILIGFIVIYLTYEISNLLSRKKITKISMAAALNSTKE
ncbi:MULTISPECIES: ABC transporter permease [Clostridium]|uniref:Predicted permease n=1 Tax=Clostridium acetobutylicum (strain ATCC 824 / DSM 792 / JCM 1419 / IAM 19013 / LMG 5710 / NBRC 13948 / NRRL B-527 / VKM B-1787 / 2291 / W) TaxID=272562 RepID=Q97IV6_CLOAB|nr:MULTISPECIES: FtsX-like permease family protein [Clostridium]AAK79501.1 Predicted permease [Clostridium acetobutylicum ATCC 824]ADZ20586.1 permease [Clostridium acetobutylicum EA 2018]AEI31860.1 permease [Clostridium acetobutylicum DSM 1731]AWV81254.1 ABC transporter permease [Clostridium acetobutylicum]MBC2392888.1 FtsX-like permease family protein [Clostridium acetobutylicum]